MYLGAWAGVRYRKSLSLLFGELAAFCLPKGRGKYKFALKLALSSRWGWACRERGGGGTRLPVSPTGARGRVGAAGPCSALLDGAASSRRGCPQPGCGGGLAALWAPARAFPPAIDALGAGELGQLPRRPSCSEARVKRGGHVPGGEGEAGSGLTWAAVVVPKRFCVSPKNFSLGSLPS